MIYLYRCPECKRDFEEGHPIGRAPRFARCPICRTHSRRVLQVPNVHYKAKGFTGAGREGGGRLDNFRHADGSPLKDSGKDRGIERDA